MLSLVDVCADAGRRIVGRRVEWGREVVLFLLVGGIDTVMQVPCRQHGVERHRKLCMHVIGS